jgi:hypothetical protein
MAHRNAKPTICQAASHRPAPRGRLDPNRGGGSTVRLSLDHGHGGSGIGKGD